MKSIVFISLAILPLVSTCAFDPVDRPVVSENGRDYVWCQLENTNYLSNGVSVSLNESKDTTIIILNVKKVYGDVTSVKLNSIEMRVARKDLNSQRRVNLEQDQVKVSCSDGVTDYWTSSATGYVKFWTCADHVLSGQFEFQCIAMPGSFYISHGIFDLKAPFVI